MTIEDLWTNLLSRNEADILSAFKMLNKEDKTTVINHLNKMVTEDGWHPEQVHSAEYALDLIKRNNE